MNKNIIRCFNEILSTAFFTGYIPFIPGTFGTLVGVLLFILFSRYAPVYYIALLLFIILAVKVSDYAEKEIFRIKDTPSIVIDEVAGYLITMISFEFNGTIESVKFIIIGFILFRIFDIWKPYPIRQSQKLEGGLGIVIDDILAGIYANLFLQFLRFSGHFFSL